MVHFLFEKTSSHGSAFESQVPPGFAARFKPVSAWLEAPNSHRDGTLLHGASVLLSENGACITFTLEDPLTDALRVKAFHSAEIAAVSAPLNEPWVPPAADGFVFFGTRADALSLPPLAISTADCLAVAFVVRAGDHVGLALVHAGWRGYAGGILQRTVEWLLERAVSHGHSPTALLPHFEAVISPAIFGCTYECGPDVAEALEAHFATRVLSCTDSRLRMEVAPILQECLRSLPTVEGAGESDKVHPDLQLLAVCDLHAMGLSEERVRVVRVNTYGHPSLPSYRAACHAGSNARRRMFTHVHLV